MWNLPYCFLSAIRTTTIHQIEPMTAPKIGPPSLIVSMGRCIMAPTKPIMNPARPPISNPPTAPRQTSNHQTLNACCQVGSSSCIAFLHSSIIPSGLNGPRPPIVNGLWQSRNPADPDCLRLWPWRPPWDLPPLRLSPEIADYP